MDKEIDLLNRQKFVEDVITLVRQLSENQKGCCFAIEGSWGIGKTFMLEMMERELESTYKDSFFQFHYNCWQYDYYEEPAVAIISAMIYSILEDKAAINKDLEDGIKAGYKVVGQKLKDIAGNYLENKIGINLISWADEIRGKREEEEGAVYEFDKMFNFNQTIENVRKNLREIAKERTIILIVDELDRCIPQYAIKVLERLHHIFYGLTNVVVVIAMDRNQLEHSVEEMFGIGNKRIEKYLQKFIDFSIELDFGSVNDLFMEKYNYYFEQFTLCEKTEYVEGIDQFFSELFLGTDIRTQEKLMEKIYVVHSVICDEPLDISVALFEIMLTVLNMWGFGSIRNLALINDFHFADLSDRLGERRMRLLSMLEKCARNTGRSENDLNGQYVLSDLFGRVFWYFYNIFNRETETGIGTYGADLVKNLEIVKKFVSFYKMIK
ncbi:MAG: KAP family NTPase [Lachnospiraceae bacterium]